MRTPSGRGEGSRSSRGPYRDPAERDAATSDDPMILRAIETSLQLGSLMLPVGLCAAVGGAVLFCVEIGKRTTPAFEAVAFLPCAGVIITIIALARLRVGVSLRRREPEAAAWARAAERITFWGDVMLVVGSVFLMGAYGFVLVVLSSPYLIPSVLQSIALGNLAAQLESRQRDA